MGRGVMEVGPDCLLIAYHDTSPASPSLASHGVLPVRSECTGTHSPPPAPPPPSRSLYPTLVHYEQTVRLGCQGKERPGQARAEDAAGAYGYTSTL